MAVKEVNFDWTEDNEANRMDDYQIYTPFKNKEKNEGRTSYCSTLSVNFKSIYTKT